MTKHKASKQYGVEYVYDGRKWAADLWADDIEDARRKLRAMAHGEIIGEIKLNIAVPSLLQRVLGWFGVR